MGWERGRGALATRPIPSRSGSVRVEVRLARLELAVVRRGGAVDRMQLLGRSYQNAESWLDAQLVAEGLQAASTVDLPYELPADVAELGVFPESGHKNDLSALSDWFDLANSVLTGMIDRLDQTAKPSPVRCWPHHFDLGTYVALEEGAAAGIGMGWSPGDHHYSQPYFYVYAHPALEEPIPAPSPGRWHDEGFRGVVATGDEILALDDIRTGAISFLEESFLLARRKLDY
jgi:hypothetical protein